MTRPDDKPPVVVGRVRKLRPAKRFTDKLREEFRNAAAHDDASPMLILSAEGWLEEAIENVGGEQ
jgi:hypothetical protein